MTRAVAALGRMADSTFGSLRVRNYRLYFIGQVVSVSGSWMQRIAQSWLVLQLHVPNAGVALGLVSALQFLPMLLFGAYGGVLADRLDKRRLLMATQTVMGLLALVLGVLTLGRVVQLWMVYTLALLLGVVTAFDNPGRQSFVMEMVGRRQVTNAVSLNSAVFTGARVVGPAVAGLLISVVGTGWCFVVNAVSFGAVVAALLAMDPARLQRVQAPARARGQLVEGLRFVLSRPDLRTPLALLAIVGTLALNFNVLLPLLARDTFHGGAWTYGLLFSVLGVGSLAGALFTAGRREPSAGRILGSLVLFGLFMLAAAAAPTLPLEMAALAPMGIAALVFQTSTNSLLQLRSEPALRGRVMALYAVVFIGTTPFGAPIVGWVAQQHGARAAFVLGAAAILVAAATGLWLARRHHAFEPASRPVSAAGGPPPLTARSPE
ncbi:MAG TPA: MFS transporter [Candidatus Dormibacteraeota bacterium]|nr:MFS transporter [Candidatus Dormibacteraeota bacterium]